MKHKIKDLSLLLIYLTSWQEDSEDIPGEKIFKAWKGYLFETLNELERENFIRQKRELKSALILTPEGMEKAKNINEAFAF